MKHIQHYLFMRFSKLNAEEFFKIAKLILSGDPRGNQFIQRMVDEIIRELRDYEVQQKFDDNNDDLGDDDLDDLLGGLGITRS